MLPQTLLLSLLALTPLASAQAYGGGGGSSSSSTSSVSPASTTSSSKSSSASTIHSITVGAGGSLVYQPDTLTAAVGDTIIFNFEPGDHSVAQSTFGAPCTPSSGGIWSGFFSSTSNAFVVTVNNTDPMWLYCGQVGHCNAGMAMVVNPPSGSTIAEYKAAAANAKAVSPKTVQGGIVETASKASAGAGSSSSAASSAPAATTSAAKTGTGSRLSHGLGAELLGFIGVGVMWLVWH